MNNDIQQEVIVRREISDSVNETPASNSNETKNQQQNNKLNRLYKITNHPNFIPGIYIVSGIILFFILATIFNTYILHLKVETAVVSSPIEAMVSPASGYVSNVYVLPGYHVKKGDKLLTVSNIDLERDLALAKIQVQDSKLNVAYYKSLLDNETQRLQVYRNIGVNRIISSQASVNISKRDLVTAKQNLERFRALHKKHYISEATWEAEISKFISAQEKLKNANAQNNLENNSLHAVDKGMYFTGNKLEGIERDLQAELTSAEERLKLNEEKEKLYQNIINKLTLSAPFDGQVTQILKSVGSTTDSVKPIVFIEQAHKDKEIVAYLTQDEVTHVSMAGKVKIYIPSLGSVYHGVIKKINRTDGFVDAIKAQYTWRDFQIDRSAMIVIDIDQSDQEKFNKYAFAGMPIIAYFSRSFV